MKAVKDKDAEKNYFKIVVYADPYSTTTNNPIPVSNGFSFEIPEGFPSEVFFDENGHPTEMASLSITKWLMESVFGNIQQAHMTGSVERERHMTFLKDNIKLLSEADWEGKIEKGGLDEHLKNKGK